MADSPRLIDLLLSASWIIPVTPKARVLEECALAIDDGKIVAIGLKSELERQYTAKSVTDLPGQALIPGLINTHGHAAMSLFRGYADDTPLNTWLEEHIWPAEQKWVSPSFVRDGSELAIAEMIASGTTCFADMYFFPEEVAAAAFDIGLRAHIYFPVLDFPTIWASDADDYIRKGLSLHDHYRAQDMISIGFGPHAPYTVSDEPLRKIATYAEELQANVQIHLHETEEEVTKSLEQFGKRPIERLDNLGLLSPLTQCVHMTQLIDEDIELVSKSGAHVIHCPESNFKLASGLCPVEQLLKANVNVSLGTDGAASNNDLDLFGEMHTAALAGKYAAKNAAALDAATVLEMATLAGAKTLGIDKNVGSLEVGKYADITAVDLSGLAQQPLHDPIAQLVYTSVGHRVSHVWVNGKVLLEDHKFTTLNPDEIKNKVQHWQQKLSK